MTGAIEEAVVPYCGMPPIPDDLWLRWNLDAVLIAALLTAFVLYMIGAHTVASQRISPWRRIVFGAGWVVAAAALISPLCPLSVALFSARVGQHMILCLVAAPLIILGKPSTAIAYLWPQSLLNFASRHFFRIVFGDGVSVALFTLMLWVWHAPQPYEATFENSAIYWLMHLTVFGSALLVWHALLQPSKGNALSVLAVGFATTVQMTFLGALITLSRQPLYARHALSPLDWGLTQMTDQQLGGLIMWVPGCAIFLTVTLVTLSRVVSDRTHPEVNA